MNRIAFVVEGDTEQNFVEDVLQTELANAALIIRNMRGGDMSVHGVLRYIKPLLHEKFACITTMVDFYGFENSGHKSSADDIERQLENAVMEASRNNAVFLPYVQKHEFEALLFADRQAIKECLDLGPGPHKKLKKIKGNPEDINHNKPPSKRLYGIHPDYEKPINGIDIAQKIGLPRIEEECPHFADWLNKLRKITKQ